MKKVKIPIGVLYEKLGIAPNEFQGDDLKYSEETHEVPCDIYVPTPTGDKAKINFLVTKKAPVSVYSFENESILKVADSHLISEDAVIKRISEAKAVDNSDGKKYKIVSKSNRQVETVYDFGIDAPHLYCTPDGSIHHNTTIASIIFLYDLARLLTLDEPQVRFKLPKSAKIFFTLTNSTIENIEQVNYDPIMTLIRESPFFRSKFNNTKSRTSLFINNIDINMVSRKHALVGKNVYAASSDEVNQEIQKGGSQNIITEMYNRINSRFLLPGNKWPGHYTMISSATTEGSVIQTMIDNAEDTDAKGNFSKKDILVISAPRFEVLKHKVDYSGETFKVFIGDYQSDPFFINDATDLAKAKAYDETKIFDVPIEHRGEFDDIYAGIRDVLGMPVSDVRTFIPFKDKIKDSLILQTACALDEIVLDAETPLMEFFKKEQIDAFRPGSQKVIGLDIAYAGDRYGLTMIHIHDTVGEGELQEYQYWVDFAVGIVPPKGEQLKLYQIREFVVQLHKMGVGVELVVSDSFQSKESLQLLEQQGISTKMYSVDRKKEAYYALRDAITSDRIKMPNNKILYRELVFLKEDEKKIDHPVTNPDGTRGSKDIADAIANALWNITHEIEYKPYLNQDFIKELDEEVSDDFDESDPFGHIFGEGVEGSWVT
jgi:hypothetical protein